MRVILLVSGLARLASAESGDVAVLPEPPTLALIGVAAAVVAWQLHRLKHRD